MGDNFRFVAFNSTKEHGQMNSEKVYYEEELTVEERKQKVQEHKQKIAEEIGFDWQKLFYPIQKTVKNNDKYLDGHTITITSDIVNTYSNLYDFNYYADIAKLTHETPYVAIANNIADCANIIAVNTKTGEAVTSHCGGEYINRYLPIETMDALGGNEKDIQVYVSPFAHQLTYDNGEPIWVSNQHVWQDCLKEENGVLVIDQLKAISRQLKERMIPEENITFSPFSTITSHEFYSNSNAYKGIKEDNGRFVSGVALVEDKDYGHNPYIKKF